MRVGPFTFRFTSSKPPQPTANGATRTRGKISATYPPVWCLFGCKPRALLCQLKYLLLTLLLSCDFCLWNFSIRHVFLSHFEHRYAPDIHLRKWPTTNRTSRPPGPHPAARLRGSSRSRPRAQVRDTSPEQQYEPPDNNEYRRKLDGQSRRIQCLRLCPAIRGYVAPPPSNNECMASLFENVVFWNWRRGAARWTQADE